MISDIKLSICCISYNHAEFISQAIDSFLSQRVDFNYEVVISDDCSNDSTSDIINNYATLYPNLIRVIPREKNVGMNYNFFSSLGSCCGEYIAICEGDDYWTDFDKLCKQIEILDRDQSLSLVTHDVDIKNDVKHTFVYNPYSKAPKSRGGLLDVIFCHFIPTLSIVLRKSRLPAVWPDFFYKVKNPDRALVLSLLINGEYQHLSEKMGVYRHHDGGITKVNHSADVLLANEIYLYDSFYSAFKLNKDRNFIRRIALAYYSACRKSFQDKNYRKGFIFLAMSLCKAPMYITSYCLKKIFGI